MWPSSWLKLDAGVEDMLSSGKDGEGEGWGDERRRQRRKEKVISDERVR